jgi:hypothetical protein
LKTNFFALVNKNLILEHCIKVEAINNFKNEIICFIKGSVYLFRFALCSLSFLFHKYALFHCNAEHFLTECCKLLSSSVVTLFIEERAISNGMIEPGNTKGGSITVPLTSCLTGLESAI